MTVTAYDRVCAALHKATGHEASNGSWICPAHEDSSPSLSVTGKADSVLLHCHAGCSTTAVLEAIGLEARDLFDKPKANGATDQRRKIVATYNYTDENGELLFQVVKYRPKSFVQRRPDGRGGWVWKVADVRPVLYNLPAVLAAREDRIIWVCEGEKDADAVNRTGEVATTCPRGAGKWRPEYTEILAGAVVVVVADNDGPGIKHARRVAAELRAAGCHVELALPRIGKDVAEHLAAGLTLDDLDPLADEAPPKTSPAKQQEPEDTYDDIPDEPGHVLLDKVRDWLADHVAYASTHHAPTVALWCAHTHALDRAASTPRLAFTSPEPESGKTRNLELLELVCHRGRLVLQMSPASLYRWVDAIRPSILLDEIDAVFGPKASKDHEDLRALINAGHRPGATVPRVETPSMRVVEFSAYCPVALAGIGALPDTIRSRSIAVPMRRRAPDETVRPYRERITRPEGEALRRRVAAWVSRHGDEIPEAPDLPEGVTDRQADQWEPLLAFADAAGGHWPATARAACTAIVNAARANTDDQSLGVRLLSDIFDVFANADRVTTADLLAKLHALDEAPWGDLRGKPVTARWLAQRLKPYGITPSDHKFKVADVDKTLKGYLREDFHDAWQRYQVMRNKGNKGNAAGREVADVADVADNPPQGNADLFATESEEPF